MKAGLSTLSLVRIPTLEGTLYLYPEYRELAPKLDISRAGRKKRVGGGSRGCYYFSSPDDSQWFVAKPERSTDDSHYSKVWRFYPKDRNLTFKEVSTARALSQHANYEDDVIVECERPLGYYEDSAENRTGLFEYKPRIFSKPDGLGLPDGLVDRINGVDERTSNTIARIEGDLKNIPKSRLVRILGIPIPIRVSRKKSSVEQDCRVLYKERAETQRRDYSLKLMEKEVYFPRVFADLVMAANGIHNDEHDDSFSYFRDEKTGKTGTFVRDFEFCSFFDEDGVERRVDSSILCMSDPDYNWKKMILKDATAHERRAELLRRLDDFSPVLARRVERYLSPRGYFGGRMERKGPAFEIISQIPQLTMDQVVV